MERRAGVQVPTDELPKHEPTAVPAVGTEQASNPATISLGDIGTPGPLQVVASGANGAWVALCQGEPPALSLVIGSGTGEPIDALYGSDAIGRFLISGRGAAIQLIDVLTGSRVDLGELSADVRRARADFSAHRALSFDARSEHLAYLRKRGRESSVVVRTLADGSERIFPSGPGEVFRLRLSADAAFVTLDVIREDTSRNGKLDWPTPEEPPTGDACTPAKPLRYRSFQGRGDALTRAVISLSDGALRDLPELVTTFGTALIVRAADGSLLIDAKGVRTLLAPASCAGRVLFADDARQLALVACDLPKKPGKREVWLVGKSFTKNLKVELQETELDRDSASGARLVPLYPGAESALVDLEKRELVLLKAGSRVIAVAGDAAVIWRGDELLRFAVDTRTEEPLAKGVAKNPELLLAGSTVLLSPFVIVGARLPALASPTARPLGLATTGHVLSGAAAGEGTPLSSRQGGASSVIHGPLHWLDARLPPPDGPPR